MAVPDYFRRNAVAISQVMYGLDEERLASMLDRVCIGVTIGADAGGKEGQATVDLLVRLLARLYPSIVIRNEADGDIADEAVALAQRINPRVNLSGQPTVEVVVGSARHRPESAGAVFAGSAGWCARLSTCRPQACGESNNPLGAGVAACLAAATLFRHVFLGGAGWERDVEFAVPGADQFGDGVAEFAGEVGGLVLAGAGAVGNAAAWALARSEVRGTIEIVDHEAVDLGNLQRYVLAERNDEDKRKAELVAVKFTGTLGARAHDCRIADFLEKTNHKVENLLLALDSAKDRRTAQASLPRRIANAWTQPGDLGVSQHQFLDGACVNCLYLPDIRHRNEDEIIAEAFGVPDKLTEVRELLYHRAGAPRGLLEAIATARGLPLDKLLAFEGRPLRNLYTEGFCGGAVIPLSETGAPAKELHVPLAHQSALAGVLLAAAGVAMGVRGCAGSFVAQYDVLKPQERFQVYPAAKRPGNTCICQDEDYREVYRKKHGRTASDERRRDGGQAEGAGARAS